MIPVRHALPLPAGYGGGKKETSCRQFRQKEAKERKDAQEAVLLDARGQDEGGSVQTG